MDKQTETYMKETTIQLTNIGWFWLLSFLSQIPDKAFCIFSGITAFIEYLQQKASKRHTYHTYLWWIHYLIYIFHGIIFH